MFYMNLQCKDKSNFKLTYLSFSLVYAFLSNLNVKFLFQINITTENKKKLWTLNKYIILNLVQQIMKLRLVRNGEVYVKIWTYYANFGLQVNFQL